MRNSLQLCVALGLCAALGTSALAAPQNAPTGGKMAGAKMGGMSRLAQQIGLTEAQKAKMQSIMKAQMPQMKALRENKTLTREQKMTKVRALRMAQMKQMVAILTPAQRKKMEAMMKERRAAQM